MQRNLRITKRDLGGNEVEAYYTEHPRPATLALQPGINRQAAAARAMEAEGYYRKRPPKGGRKFCFAPRHPYDFDAGAINAIRSVIDELKPSWVADVREACRISNDTRWIAAYCELSPQVVIAIVRNLEARQELLEGAE